MKYAASTFMLMILMVLVGTAVWAACPGTCSPQPVMQCPVVVAQPVEVCPGTCPQAVQVCPGTCPEVAQCPQICCSSSIPAAVGAGPADISGIPCPDFDLAYAQGNFQQNATIIAVTEIGMQRAKDRNLRDISREIHGQFVSINDRLMPTVPGCALPVVDMTRAQEIAGELCGVSAECFDATYARTLSALLKQSQTRDELAMTRAVNEQLRQQAQFMAAKENDWSFRLDRWVNDHGF